MLQMVSLATFFYYYLREKILNIKGNGMASKLIYKWWSVLQSCAFASQEIMNNVALQMFFVILPASSVINCKIRVIQTWPNICIPIVKSYWAKSINKKIVYKYQQTVKNKAAAHTCMWQHWQAYFYRKHHASHIIS